MKVAERASEVGDLTVAERASEVSDVKVAERASEGVAINESPEQLSKRRRKDEQLNIEEERELYANSVRKSGRHSAGLDDS